MRQPGRWPTRPEGIDIQAIIDQLDALPEAMRAGEAMTIAAAVIESAAYEIAQSEESKQVERLILLAAHMERVAMALRTECRLQNRNCAISHN